MATQRTKFTVGLFLTLGIGIGIVVVIWVGMSGIMQKGHLYATYFDESVQGLNVDSPVKYRGVSVGRVKEIGVAPDSKLVQVILKIESDLELESDMVAQLRIVGITGSMFVEMDRRKEGEPDQSPSLSFPAKYPVLASKPSEISELIRGIDDLLTQIRAMDLGGISEKFKMILDNTHQIIADANMKGFSENLNTLMTTTEKALLGAEKALGTIDNLVADNETAIQSAIADFSGAMENANTFFAEAASLAGETDDSVAQLTRHLLVVAENLEEASINLNQLIDFVSDHPSQLILGEPPIPRKIEPAVSK